MNIKQLLEEFTKLDEMLFVELDVKKLFDTIHPKEHGFIDDEEIQQVKDCIGLTGNESVEKLTGMRNTIKRYGSDLVDTLRNKVANVELPEEERKEADKQIDIVLDQTSAFDAVLEQQIAQK